MKISFQGSEVFDRSIKMFVLQELPSRAYVDKIDLIDLITNELLGTKQVRLGPKPSPETQVAIRDVIRHYVALNRPIPFMVPWGSEKPDGSSIDIAELMGLKTFICLQNRVSAHYTPGVRLNIRVEDASAPHLFDEDPIKAWNDADAYSTAFANLVKILGAESFIKVKRESHAVSVDQFNAEADMVLSAMEYYISGLIYGHDSTKALSKLKDRGWSGELQPETLEYYMSSYSKLYPEMTKGDKAMKIARYMAGALARARLGIRGDEKEWEGKFIDLSFVQNPPGTNNRFNRRIIYRTIPSNITSNHIPPWRAKGYLVINEDGEAIPKLASYNDYQHLESLNLRTMTLTKDGHSVTLNADYITV